MLTSFPEEVNLMFGVHRELSQHLAKVVNEFSIFVVMSSSV